jgi:hypothetical protein
VLWQPSPLQPDLPFSVTRSNRTNLIWWTAQGGTAEKIRSNSVAPLVVGRSSCDIKRTCLVERLVGPRALWVLFWSWTRPHKLGAGRNPLNVPGSKNARDAAAKRYIREKYQTLPSNEQRKFIEGLTLDTRVDVVVLASFVVQEPGGGRDRCQVPFATRMQLLGSLNSCRITYTCTHTSDV